MDQDRLNKLTKEYDIVEKDKLGVSQEYHNQNIFRLIFEILIRPARFFDKTIRFHEAPYLPIFIWFIGMSNLLDRSEKFSRLTQNITLIWVYIAVIGVINGYLSYLCLGWWFNKRIEICGGELNKRTGRFIYLYSLVPVSLYSIIVSFYGSWKYGIGYFNNNAEISPLLDLFNVMMIVLLVWSTVTSYKGVITLHKPSNSKKTKFWFIIGPIILYFVIIFAAMISDLWE